MKKLSLLFILWLFCTHVTAQTNLWRSYYDKKTELTGYKDAQGKIKVPAKFGLITHTGIFRNIVPVSEEISKDKFTSYYLLKSGKKVGADSVYIWYFTTDCENEEKIRFRDPKKDRVGFFDKSGKITIPAVYNDAQPFHNGLALTIRNGQRMCDQNKPYDKANPCEHWYWQGITAIINTQNQILVDSLNDSAVWQLNLYSLKVGNQPLDTTLYVNFKGTNGQYYSFIDYEKEFQHWFYKSYLPHLNAGYIRANLFKEIRVAERRKRNEDVAYTAAAFEKKYAVLLLKKMKVIQKAGSQAIIVHEDLQSLLYESAAFKSYYTDCGSPDKEKFPIYSVIVDTYDNHTKTNNQESFVFLRTASGYKLIGMGLN